VPVVRIVDIQNVGNMKSKKCSKCKNILQIDNFGLKNKKYRSECKECRKKERQTENGLITSIYSSQKSNSKRRGHLMPEYSKIELIKWLYNNNFKTLYNNWVKSNYNSNLKPSVDRLNDERCYSFSNIRLVTWHENNKKGYSNVINGVDKRKLRSVNKYSVWGYFLRTYYSISQAERETNISSSRISSVCKNEKGTAGGFMWRYNIGINLE